MLIVSLDTEVLGGVQLGYNSRVVYCYLNIIVIVQLVTEMKQTACSVQNISDKGV